MPLVTGQQTLGVYFSRRDGICRINIIPIKHDSGIINQVVFPTRIIPAHPAGSSITLGLDWSEL